MPDKHTVAQLRKEFADKSDDDLIYETEAWVQHSDRPTAARQVLLERETKRYKESHGLDLKVHGLNRKILAWAIVAAIASVVGALAGLWTIFQPATPSPALPMSLPQTRTPTPAVSEYASPAPAARSKEQTALPLPPAAATPSSKILPK